MQSGGSYRVQNLKALLPVGDSSMYTICKYANMQICKYANKNKNTYQI